MQHRDRTLRRTGLAVTLGAGVVLGGGLAAAPVLGGMAGASAHRAVDTGATSSWHRHQLAGTVTSVGTGTFTLQTPDGRSVTVATTPATTYREPGASAQPAGVVPGDRVVVHLATPSATAGTSTPGTSTGSGTSGTSTSGTSGATTGAGAPTPTAASVTILPERVSGTVSSVTSTTIVVDDDGSTRSVLVSPSTAYREHGRSVGLGTVATGDTVVATGYPDTVDPADLDAIAVWVQSAPAPAPASQPQPVQPQPQPGPSQQPSPASQPQPRTPTPTSTPQPAPEASQSPPQSSSRWSGPASGGEQGSQPGPASPQGGGAASPGGPGGPGGAHGGGPH